MPENVFLTATRHLPRDYAAETGRCGWELSEAENFQGLVFKFLVESSSLGIARRTVKDTILHSGADV